MISHTVYENALLSVAPGRGGRRGTSAPSGTVKGAAFGGQKYGILKFGRFWRIGVCIAARVHRHTNAIVVTIRISIEI